jgi:osmotically-inducible protein OsmY
VPQVQPGQVDVQVRNGVVVVSGSVATGTVASNLTAAAWEVPGVVSVRDDLVFEFEDRFLPRPR